MVAVDVALGDGDGDGDGAGFERSMVNGLLVGLLRCLPSLI
jgi:hypothetical protein